jgi:glutamate-1-semialdehyde 2,1-aminomutase
VDTPAIFMDHAEGSKIYDIDGNEYIDYVLSVLVYFLVM